MKKSMSIIVFLVLAAILVACNDNSTIGRMVDKPDYHKGTINQGKIIVAGSGSNLSITRKLAEIYMKDHPGSVIEVPDSLGSGGGVKSVSEGIIDVGLISRPLTASEGKYNLIFTPYAEAGIIFATNNKVDIKNISTQHLVRIYEGQITNWKEMGGEDRAIVLLVREEKDSSRIVLNENMSSFGRTNNHKEAIILLTDQLMNDAIAAVPYSIGWTDLGAITIDHYDINPLKIDGIEPNIKNMKSGNYPYKKQLAFVYKQKSQDLVQDFIQWVISPEGQIIIEQNGYLPLKGK